jgi:hypothetical protein
VSLVKQAEALYHKLAIERARAKSTNNPVRYIRIALVQDSVLDRIERRKAKCGLCGKQSGDLTPNKYQGQLCGVCYLIYECW